MTNITWDAVKYTEVTTKLDGKFDERYMDRSLPLIEMFHGKDASDGRESLEYLENFQSLEIEDEIYDNYPDNFLKYIKKRGLRKLKKEWPLKDSQDKENLPDYYYIVTLAHKLAWDDANMLPEFKKTEELSILNQIIRDFLRTNTVLNQFQFDDPVNDAEKKNFIQHMKETIDDTLNYPADKIKIHTTYLVLFEIINSQNKVWQEYMQTMNDLRNAGIKITSKLVKIHGKITFIENDCLQNINTTPLDKPKKKEVNELKKELKKDIRKIRIDLDKVLEKSLKIKRYTIAKVQEAHIEEQIALKLPDLDKTSSEFGDIVNSVNSIFNALLNLTPLYATHNKLQLTVLSKYVDFLDQLRK